MGIKGKKTKNKVALIFLTIIVVVLCVGVSTAAFFYNYIGKFSRNVENKAKDVKPVIVNKDEPINVLVLGVDIGDPGSTNNENAKRTDTMMLAHYDPKNNDLSVISIPRDTLIQIKGKNQKINAAYSIGGVKYSIKSVEEMLGTVVNYYVKLDYEGFRKVIDAIGGIDMDIAQDMNYDDNAQNLHIHFKKGEKVHLDGKKAEEFFRWRKNNDGTGLADGDLGRIDNQHEFVGKVADKFKSAAILTRLNDILKILPEYVETNMPVDNLISYGMKLSKLPSENLKLSTIKGDPQYIGGISYFVYNQKKNSDILAQINNSSTNTKKVSKDGLDKGKLKVKVLNGTDTNGLAKSFSNSISNLGYDDVIIGNGTKTSKSKVLVKKNNKELQKIAKEDFKINNIGFVSEKDGNFDIIVLLGTDYEK